MAPRIQPQRLQDQFMAELHEELSKHLARAALWSATVTAQSLSRERRHSQTCSLSHVRSPSADGRRKENANQPRGDFLSRNSQPHSRGNRNRAQQQSPLPEHQEGSELPFWASTRPHRHTSLSPSPPCPLCKDEWLFHPLSKLRLQPQQQES